MTSQGIIDSLTHAPLQLLNRVLDTRGPYSGDVTLTSGPAGGVLALYQGVLVAAASVPAGLGYRIGYVAPDGRTTRSYYFPLAQVSVWYDILGGSKTLAQVNDVTTPEEIVLWERTAPSEIGLHVLPGVVVALYFLAV